MAAIAHAPRVNTTSQTTTNNGVVDATNGDIASGSFTTGDKYLILCAAQLRGSSTNHCGIRVVHGSTAFADSEEQFRPGGNFALQYFWWTVWTAVSGEDINIQFTSSSGLQSVPLNFIVLLAINLSHNVLTLKAKAE